MQKSVLITLLTSIFCSPAMALEVSDQLDVSGLIELEYGASRSDSGNDYGTALATGAFGATVKPNDKLETSVTFLYEEDLHEVSTPFELDEATVTWHVLQNGKLDIVAGKKYLPFGAFESGMVSDPLTLELAETRRNGVLQASTTQGKFNAVGYFFNSTSPKTDDTGKHDGAYGLGIGYSTENLSAGVQYLSNLAESGAFDPKDVKSKVPAIGVHGSATFGRITLLGEHIAATKDFQPGDLDGGVTSRAKPSASQFELNLDLQDDRILAVAWNRTKGAEMLDLSKEYYGATYSQPVYKNISGAVELVQSKGYDGAKDKTFTAQIAYEF